MKNRAALVAVLICLVSLTAGAQDVSRPWFVGLDNGVYRYQDGDYRRVGLGSAVDLAVNGDTPYVIGNDGRVWSSPGGDGSWAPFLPGLLGRRLAADVDASLYVIGVDGGVYRAKEGRVSRMGLAVATDVSADRGTVYVIGTDSRVWYCPPGGDWQMYNAIALGRRVSAANGQVFIIGTDGGVYRVTSNRFSRVGLATAQDLALSPEGVPYIVGLDGYVWRYPDSWQRYGTGQAKAVAFPR